MTEAITQQIEYNVDEKYKKEKKPTITTTPIYIKKIDKIKLNNIRSIGEPYGAVVARLIKEHYVLQLLKKKINIK